MLTAELRRDNGPARSSDARMMKLLLAVALLCAAPLPPEQEPLDGPKRIFRDDLLESLAGKWALTRKKGNAVVRNDVDADWVLNHQFLRIHMTDAATPPQYEAMVFVGYDHASERHVAHWLDVLGGRSSETLGFGARDGNSIRFVFEYPDGPFHNTFTWDPQEKTWSCLLEQKDSAGRWTTLAADSLRRAQ
jgi:hypothetical protein